MNKDSQIESSFCCVFCGNTLFKTYKTLENSEYDGEGLKCKKCDAYFYLSDAEDPKKRAGDSFSITYWK